jgi:hypothetical protein
MYSFPERSTVFGPKLHWMSVPCSERAASSTRWNLIRLEYNVSIPITIDPTPAPMKSVNLRMVITRRLKGYMKRYLYF